VVFPLLDDPLELFLAFDLLAVLHGVLDSKFKFCVFCYQCTHQGGGVEKSSVEYIDLIVMSH
jgi:hypothetical protein